MSDERPVPSWAWPIPIAEAVRRETIESCIAAMDGLFGQNGWALLHKNDVAHLLRSLPDGER
jgi:hypothetical protein